MKLVDRLQHSWNAFMNKDPTDRIGGYGPVSSYRPERIRSFVGNQKSLVAAYYTRIAIDVASATIKHVKIDDNEKYKETVNDSLNNCLTLEANIDQTGRAFIQSSVESLFDEGVIAIVPTVTNDNPTIGHAFDVEEMRCGQITQWYPKHVRVKLWNNVEGRHQEYTFPKSMVSIIENPLYTIMNEPNSTVRRLLRKLSLLDAIDEQSGSGKLDLIIQLPYSLKSEQRKREADQRRKDIEMQLTGSKYGIAYIDGTEHITQLNRAVENNLMKQVEYLQNELKNQLGLTDGILNGTASEQEMLNYNNRTIEPILSAITDELKRKFLSKTARSQGHSIMFFKDPFKLVPVQNIADIADKFTRNEILSSNEVRTLIGFQPVASEQADALKNKNINSADGATFATTDGKTISTGPADSGNVNPQSQISESPATPDDLSSIMNEMLDGLLADVDELLGGK